jgi:Holliday junction resolvasome RuvABC endonuclease subunit
MKVVGIDPGLEGAIAVIDRDTGYVSVADMPVEFGEIDCRSLHAILKGEAPNLVVIEKLHGQPAFGAANFKLGGSYYAAVYCCQILSIPMERVTPQRWKKAILEGTKKDKPAAVKWARGAYPNVSLYLEGSKKTSHDRAEALALAEFGLRIRGGHCGEFDN